LCAFLVNIYRKVNDQNKNNLRHISRGFVKDETSMVGRSALKYLPALWETLPSNTIIDDVAKEILTQTLQDNEDSVRLLLPASLSVISGELDDTERAALIIPIIKSIVKDGPWRIRSSLANELPTIAKPFPVNSVVNDISPFLLRLLRDPEAEAKTAT
jgi:serine/threonine-protein phosphatase 2A regulatory subunit A